MATHLGNRQATTYSMSSHSQKIGWDSQHPMEDKEGRRIGVQRGVCALARACVRACECVWSISHLKYGI